MTVFCPECHLIVAPHAPDKRHHNGMAFHATCLVKYLLRIDMQRRVHHEVRLVPANHRRRS